MTLAVLARTRMLFSYSQLNNTAYETVSHKDHLILENKGLRSTINRGAILPSGWSAGTIVGQPTSPGQYRRTKDESATTSVVKVPPSNKVEPPSPVRADNGLGPSLPEGD